MTRYWIYYKMNGDFRSETIDAESPQDIHRKIHPKAGLKAYNKIAE